MTTAATDALAAVPDGARLVCSPSCGAPDTLLLALAEVADSDRDWTLYSGLLLGSYPFLDAVEAGRLDYVTSHVTERARGAVASGAADFLPIRASHIGSAIRRWADRSPLVALVRLTPPVNGVASLGVSTAYSRLAFDIADVVIAEVDPDMPWTTGDAEVPAARVTHWVQSASPLIDYRQPEPDTLSDAIAERVMELLPDRPVLQMGIGGVPEAISRRLVTADTGPIRMLGMIGDATVALAEAGRLATPAGDPPVLGVDLMGTSALWRWAHQNPLLSMRASERVHAPSAIGGLERLVSINSAVEIDLFGQINAESVGGRQISGTGGSFDFVEAALTSAGGRSIVAMSSTAGRDRRSRIVPRLDAGTAVTIPRFMVDTVVTEHGVGELRGTTVRERAEALVEIADPEHRDRLAAELPHLMKGIHR